MAASEEGMKQAVAAGFSQADEFLSALHSLLEQGITRLRRYQIDQLLSYSTARGSHHPGLVRQAGSVRTANDPASVIEPYDTVLWWRAEAPGLAGSQVWSSRERAWLQKQGVKVPDQEEELARQAQSWHRPVLAAVQRLIFMLPPEDVEKHPLWLTISALFPGIPVQHIERRLGEAGCSPQNAVAHRDLPLCKPRLQLERGVPMPDRPFSATSLERFIYNPYEWVLAYAARLSPSRVLEVSAGQRLYGILAHRMVQQLVLDLREGLLDAGRFEAWYEREFPRLVDAEGATLLMPGKGSELEGVRIRIRQAIAGLLPFLQKQGASRMETEYELKGTFPGGSLHGFADLLLFDREGRPSLIDMKWGGAESYRKSLAEGTHLQLIIYAGLVRQQTGKWPAIAYYMLGRAQLIAQREDLFEGASVVRNSSGQSTAELWDRFLVSFAWRLDQLRQGSIEVAPETADELMPVPEEGLKPVLLNKEYNPYRTLEGWERGT
jgi:hypothetical protein